MLTLSVTNGHTEYDLMEFLKHETGQLKKECDSGSV